MFDLLAMIADFNSRADLLSMLGGSALRRAGRDTKRGETWAGPCPLCGGSDRLQVCPEHPSGAQAWCRPGKGCGFSGDPVKWAMRLCGRDPGLPGETGRFIRDWSGAETGRPRRIAQDRVTRGDWTQDTTDRGEMDRRRRLGAVASKAGWTYLATIVAWAEYCAVHVGRGMDEPAAMAQAVIDCELTCQQWPKPGADFKDRCRITGRDHGYRYDFDWSNWTNPFEAVEQVAITAE